MNFIQNHHIYFVIQKFRNNFGHFSNRRSIVSMLELKQDMSALHSKWQPTARRRGTSILLNELDLELDTFYEDESATLEVLPVDSSRLVQLLEYLEN